MRRILSFFLAAVMCLTMLPLPTDAAETQTQTAGEAEAYASSLSGAGTAADPYLISTAADLVEFRKLVNGGETGACARLTDDIVFHPGTFTYDETTYDPLYNGAAVPEDLEQWTPIGVPKGFSLSDGWYTGTFDGAGHTISGLYSNYQTEVSMYGMSAAALFCGIGKGGVVKNLRIANSYLRGDGAASVALACQGSIIACMNEATVIGMPKASGNLNYAGGILCLAMYTEAKIERCLNLGTLVGSGGNRGGIAAKNGIATIAYGGMNLTLNIPGTSGFKYNYYRRSTSGTSIAGCVEANEKKLASGEVTFLLNSNRADGDALYGQTIGQADCPSFNGLAVYQVLACDGKTVAYSNDDQDMDHEYTDREVYGQCVACNKTVYIRCAVSGSDPVWVESLEEAFNATAGTTAEIRLYQAVQFSGGPMNVVSGDITLDLNGYTVTSSEDVKISFAVNGGALTVLDSSDAGTGKIVNGYTAESAAYGAITVNDAALTVKSGTVEAANNFAIAVNGGTARIEGGTFTSQLDYSAHLNGEITLTGGRFKGITMDKSLSDAVAEGYALKLLDEAEWDMQMAANQYAQQIQVRQIPYTNPRVSPDEASTFEGYTEDVAPKYTVSVDGTASVYRWYEVLADGTEQLLGDQVKNTLTLPAGKTAGVYQYRWEAEEDDLMSFGYVTATVVAIQDPPEIPDDTEPTHPSVGAPSLETEPPRVEIPDPVISSAIPGALEKKDIIVLDAAPLQGMTLNELAQHLSFEGMDGYILTLSIAGNSGDGKVRTSDRLTVTVRDGSGKILASRSFVLCVMGDINCDGMTLANDAAMVMRIKLGTAEAADEVVMAADMDGNGTLSANDSRRLIYKYYNWSIDYQSVLQ